MNQRTNQQRDEGRRTPKKKQKRFEKNFFFRDGEGLCKNIDIMMACDDFLIQLLICFHMSLACCLGYVMVAYVTRFTDWLRLRGTCLLTSLQDSCD